MLRRNMSAPFVVTASTPAGRVRFPGTRSRAAVYEPAVVDRPLDEAELVERARRGDLDAWETLVRAYQGIAFRTAYLLGGQRRRRRGGRAGRLRQGLPRARPLPARRAVQALAAADRRQRGSQPPPLGRPPRSARAARGTRDRPGDAAPSPEAALLAREHREQLLAALNGLPDDHRDAIACRYFLDLSEEETAAALGRPARARSSRASRARSSACARAGGRSDELARAAAAGARPRARLPAGARARAGRARAARQAPFPWRWAGARGGARRAGSRRCRAPARTAILRFFHLRGATIELVETLPPAQERSKAGGLGARVSRAEAERRSASGSLLPPLTATRRSTCWTACSPR